MKNSKIHAKFTKTIAFRVMLINWVIFIASVTLFFVTVFFSVASQLDRKNRDLILGQLREYKVHYKEGGIDGLIKA